MGEAKWTPEQFEAITADGCNLLVAAAAGAGKTAVLVERVIRKITCAENPVDIDKLLIVTFTNAAATEMKERIGNAISRALDETPSSSLLQRQLTLLQKASITTIHSFCLEVIRNNFHLLDLDPSFGIMDATESVLLKSEALEELFDEEYQEGNGDEAFYRLVESYGGSRDDTKLQRMVLSLYEFVQSHPWPETWLRESTQAFHPVGGTDFAGMPWAGILLQSLKIEMEGLQGQLQTAVDICRRTPGLEPYLACLEEELGGMRSLASLLSDCGQGGGFSIHADGCGNGNGFSGHTWDGLRQTFMMVEFKRLPRCGKDADEIAKGRVQALRNEAKKRMEKIGIDVFCHDAAQINADLLALYPLLGSLSQLVMDFSARYALKKRERSLLDFNDLEHFCLSILTRTDDKGDVAPSEIAMSYRARFSEVLVDEYQDSNLIQEVIIGAVSQKNGPHPNLFMVGDVKQSIYRFRQARPELFLEKYNTYPGAAGSDNRKILLYKNFRSREGIIHAVNFIFRQAMSETVGELDYTEAESLNFGAGYPETDKNGTAARETEIHIIETANREDTAGNGYDYRDGVDDEDAGGRESDDTSAEGSPYDFNDVNEEKGDTVISGEQPDVVQSEARLIARRIRELMLPGEDGRAFEIYDKKRDAGRKLEYKDIVILLRSMVNWAGVFAEELGAEGIPVYADTGAGLFKTIEVQTMLSLLQIIDNPMQDIPMLAVLRSPIASFSPDELVDIRLADREATFYEAMRKAAQTGTAGTEDNTVFDVVGKAEYKAEPASDASPDTAAKAAEFLKRLENWRNEALSMSTDELIWYLFTDTGYYSFAGALPGGALRQANLRMLLEKARQFEETSFKGLFNFISFINRLRSGGGDMGSAKILGENENVVRIMSIHKSKGLEFPVVFVAGCGKRFNLRDMNEPMLFHQDLGFGPDLVDVDRRTVRASIPKQVLKYKIRKETLSEEMRILYVAFTRAREKLIIVGSTGNMDTAAARWAEHIQAPGLKLPEYAVLGAGCYLDWIIPAVMRHKDGAPLRKGLQASDVKNGAALADDPSHWAVKLWNKTTFSAPVPAEGSIAAAETDDGLTEGPVLPEADLQESEDVQRGQDMLYQEVSRRLGWTYPHSFLSRMPAKVSVTELKRISAEAFSTELAIGAPYQTDLVKRPRFMERQRKMTPAEKGTALHFVMQHLDMNYVSEPDAIKRQLDEMISKELITRQQADVVELKRILDFYRSPLGKRLLAAQEVHREVSFNVELSADELFGTGRRGDTLQLLPSDMLQGKLAAGAFSAEEPASAQRFETDDTILLQGVVDCYFQEGDGLVLLDYKTDFVPDDGADILKERYRAQIEYYTLALEKLLGKRVTARYIYLFWNGRILEY